MNSTSSPRPPTDSPTSQVVMRDKPPTSRKSKQHRRISCKDLGGGDCQGWLMMKKKNGGFSVLRSKWDKFWFVLTKKNLFYYKQPNDDSYLGRFHLPGFIASPVEKEGTSKYAFRVRHDAIGTFIFASDRRDDMLKWLNKLFHATTTPNAIVEEPEYSSDEEESVETDSKPPQRRTSDQTDTDVCELLKTLRRSNVDMLGESLDMTARRRTLWVSTCPSPTDNSTLPQQPPSSLPAVPPPSPPLSHQKCSQLLALRRTLKDKESELAAINDLLSSRIVSSESLTLFCHRHPSIVSQLHPNADQQQQPTCDKSNTDSANEVEECCSSE